MALKPIAGPFAFIIFARRHHRHRAAGAAGPRRVAAYAVGEALGWHVGLARKCVAAPEGVLHATSRVAFVPSGAILNFVHIDPIKALFWSAVINGVVAVPLMVLIMHMASRRVVMADFKLNIGLKTLGWIATAVMAAAAVGMFATMGT